MQSAILRQQFDQNIYCIRLQHSLTATMALTRKVYCFASQNRFQHVISIIIYLRTLYGFPMRKEYPYRIKCSMYRYTIANGKLLACFVWQSAIAIIMPLIRLLYYVPGHVCSQKPCLNGGTCLPASTSPFYTCNCPAGLTGDHCQSK